MKKPIFLKLFISYVILIALFSFLMLFISFRIAKKNYIDTLTADLGKICISLEDKVLTLVKSKREKELTRMVRELSPKIATRITVIDGNGVVVADSEEDPSVMENHKNRPELKKALKGREGTSIRFSSTVKEEMLYVAVPVEENGEVIAAIRASLFLKDIKGILADLRKRTIEVTLLIGLIALIFSSIFSARIVKPVKELCRAAGRVASGDFSSKVILDRDDELKDLAVSFNHMTDQIKSLFQQLTGQKDELDNIIASITEGLLVLGVDGKILLANQTFKKIIGAEKFKGSFYWEIIKEPDFAELVKIISGERKNISKEILLKNRTFLCNAAFLEAKEEIVIVFYDLTQIRELEKIKKDFVINISHELKTPLTSIKGYVETIEEDPSGENMKYLGIIKRNTERLINIVKDLLMLAELEEGKEKFEFKKVNITDLLENVAKLFEPKAKSKNIEFEICLPEKKIILTADSFKIEQMLINLVDNAVKYTDEGSVRVSLREDGRNVYVEVADTGIGIKTEDIQRIFERFYVADKSRSRMLGGTGLGLSIVKHIVLQHNGDIKVSSAPSKGTRFSVVLPYNPA
ncbi:MAG: ATP-binding protein [bacterium]|nr:ATP-binding protein [bacterium]